MISKYLAKKFLEPLTEKLGYNINIINENGIIIASSDDDRVDTFHEAAYRLMKEKQDIAKVYSGDKNLLGVKPGVNLPVHYNNDVIGVVGVTGDPNEVQAVAYAIKTSLETMIEYEYYKDSIFLRQSEKNIFINMLLYEKTYDAQSLAEMADRLHYSSSLYRAPIAIAITGSMSPEDFLASMKRCKLHSSQDLSCITIDRNILVFKTIRIKTSDLLGGYRRQAKAYTDELMSVLKTLDAPVSCKFYAGNFEKSLGQYRRVFEQTHWCLENVACAESHIVFFMDHVEPYLISRIPRIDISDVFASSYSLMKKSDKDGNLLSTIKVVYDSGMNLQKASAVLGVHRNTIYQRVKRLEEMLGLDPVNDGSAKAFLYYLTHGLSADGK